MDTSISLTTLVQALIYLAYGGAVYVSGKIYSQLLETIPAWQDKVPSWAKRWIVLFISMFIAAICVVLLELPQDVLEHAKPFLLAFGLTCLNWWSSQKEYERMKAEEK